MKTADIFSLETKDTPFSSWCAQVLANALNLELYRVDFSKVTDKSVGETEQSISAAPGWNSGARKRPRLFP